MYVYKILFVAGLFFLPNVTFAVLSCSVTTAGACTGTILLRMSGSANAHSELPSQSTANYASNVICCSGSQTISTSCSDTFATILKLKAVTNSHAEQNSQSNYTNNACMSVSAGSVTVAYQANNCTGYDTTLASMSATTNAQIGNTTAYTTKICGSEVAGGGQPQTLTFTISSNQIFFGQVSAVATSYASSTNSSGSSVEVEAHNFTVNTNADSGYTVTVKGDTLNLGVVPQNATNTISAIGGTNTVPSIGVEQFGLRMTATGGIGIVSSPYSASGFAYGATANSPSTVSSAVSGDSATTTYSVRYMTNRTGNTESGNYSANLTYVATANF